MRKEEKVKQTSRGEESASGNQIALKHANTASHSNCSTPTLIVLHHDQT